MYSAACHSCQKSVWRFRSSLSSLETLNWHLISSSTSRFACSPKLQSSINFFQVIYLFGKKSYLNSNVIFILRFVIWNWLLSTFPSVYRQGFSRQAVRSKALSRHGGAIHQESVAEQRSFFQKGKKQWGWEWGGWGMAFFGDTIIGFEVL